jgi:DNA-binding NtrC family response regulator
MNRVLVVDDEPAMRAALHGHFVRRGWLVDAVPGVGSAVSKFKEHRHPLVITDIRMPDGNGLELMREIRAISPEAAIILLTAYAHVPDAVRAIREGACDYLVKPVSFEQLEATAQRVLGRNQVDVGSETSFVGHSFALLKVLARARQVAKTDADILIEAESGTGKELLARMIHRLSSRKDRPFVAVNCAACPETLLESELFGHVKGAFTGATVTKPGKFELASGGTLLLDEIGEMPLALQPKLLRVLQERELDRLGDTRTFQINLRVIATTNQPLWAAVQQGKFREDLFYRLNVIPLALPPLRERSEDVPELAQHFAQRYALPGLAPVLSPEFHAGLVARSWPGNVRELANFVRRAMALSPNGELGMEALREAEITEPVRSSESLRPGISLRDAERQLLISTLAATGGNRSRAAEMLGVSLRTVRNKIRDYGLPPRGSYAND